MKIITTIALALTIISCNSSDDRTDTGGINYRDEMRNLVKGISQKAKAQSPGFVIIPQNGIELVSSNGDEDGQPVASYLAAIDGNGQEDLFYGYVNDDEATPAAANAYLRGLLDISKNAGKAILVTDYCSTPQKVAASYEANQNEGYISYAAPERSLNLIPTGAPHNVNNANITTLQQAKNFLYLINPDGFATKQAFIDAVAATNYDVVIVDLYLDSEAFTAAEINQLKQKANGGTRLVICYMSIGEAEDYRYYWQQSWGNNPPSWLAAENPDWPGNYKVRYWNTDWQNIIYSGNGSYLDKITAAGFNGVYLDIIDAFEYFD